MRLSIIIVNYNVRYFLEQCLHSVAKSATGFSHEIIVVDNASSDESRTYLERRFPLVVFIWNDKNLGYGKANNQGLKIAKGEFILFLNPDTIIPEDCLERCMQHLRTKERAGALGIRMLDGTGNFLRESKRGFPTPNAAFYKLTGLSALFPRSQRFSRYHMGHLDPLQNHVTDVLAGAFMMATKQILDKIGGFDEKFFMYGEDIDLSFRIQQAGFENHYFAETPIIHFKGESTQKGSLKQVRLFYGAMAIFARKHYGSWRAGFFSACLHGGIWIRALFTALGIALKWLTSPIQKKILSRKNHVAGIDQHQPSQILVAASGDDYKRVLNLLQHSKAQTGVPGRISLKTGDGTGPGTIQGITNLLRRISAREVIFCPDYCSYKDIISLMQQLPGQVRIRISRADTESIIGSGYSIGKTNEKG
jgi:GT2 family glycosyltransferase